MKDQIFDIITDLLREDITKTEAIDKLSVLYEAKISLPDRNQLQEEAKKYVCDNNEKVDLMSSAYYEYLKLERILDVIYNKE